ncbi:MAG: GMC family oxidoreductase [Variovorax sp.]|nr:MAG: GMC family oxidoreductase [Variovorax sp.]
MTFRPSAFENFIAGAVPAQSRLFPQYRGSRTDFDIVIVGSGMGGGLLADDLADRLGSRKRILVLEAGTYLFPTHVYNLCRFSNADVASRFGCQTFWQMGHGGSEYYIHEQPQLNFGGRSIFWSGLIPTIQPWELEFFPPRVRADLAGGLLRDAADLMNASVTMGNVAGAIVAKLRQSPLSDHFDIAETPRALHQPYLTREGAPRTSFSIEPTGVFNTAELLINQLGLAPSPADGNGSGLYLLLNHYVEDIRNAAGDSFQLVVRDTLSGDARYFEAGTVVLAGGSIESPKLLRRSSSLFDSLPGEVQALVGRGLTDHPTTDWLGTLATAVGDVPIPPDSHAKVIFYSRGLNAPDGSIRYPFNVEMNVNHEYWHLRENDPSAGPPPPSTGGASRVEIKFSFGNCLDDNNAVRSPPPYGYVPEIAFRNLNWVDYLARARFPALAGWNNDPAQIFGVLNAVARDIFDQFSHNGSPCQVEGAFGQDFKDFGFGTVHHAVGTLRMPSKSRRDGPFAPASVVDEDLRVMGTRNLYACDMSVMPFSSAANPVRTLAALALRLSHHFG